MRKLFFVIIILSVGSICHAQKIRKETVNSGGVKNNITQTDSGMYDGTKSEQARKHFLKASDYANKRDLNNAIKFYLKAIKEDSEFVEAYDNLGRVYRSNRQMNKAIEYYKKSIKLYPNGIMAHQNLAVVYGIQKDYPNAIKEYQEILKISPYNAEGYFGLANSYMMTTQFDLALTNAKKALEYYETANSPHLTDGHYMMGLIYFYLKDSENAKKHLQIVKDKGVKIDPQIEDELFSKKATSASSSTSTYKLESKEDYQKYEEEFIDGFNWLMKTPIGTEPLKRQEISAFLFQWMSGSPYVTIDVSPKIITYMDCGDCLTIFMAGWTKYALETNDYKNKFKLNLAGTESAIQFYLDNKDKLGKNKDIEKLIKLKEKNKLEQFIKKNI